MLAIVASLGQLHLTVIKDYDISKEVDYGN